MDELIMNRVNELKAARDDIEKVLASCKCGCGRMGEVERQIRNLHRSVED